MEAIARLMGRHQQSLQHDDPQPAPRTEMDEDSWTAWLAVPTWAHRWKRLVIILDIANTHALTGSLITYLEQAREFKAMEALNVYQKLPGKDQIATRLQKTRTQYVNVPKPMAKGRALPRSKVNTFPLDPRSCPHNQEDMSGPRGTGGKFAPLKWLTCLKCGSRWERIWEDLVPLPVSSQARPSTAPPLADEEFTELFTEDELETQFVAVPPTGRMVTVGNRRVELSTTAIEGWTANQTTLPIPTIPPPSTASTALTPEVQETPTQAMSACHHAIQLRIQGGMTPQVAVDHAWASCNGEEELGAMRAYMLANPMLQLSQQ
jgi:hypothetical protein